MVTAFFYCMITLVGLMFGGVFFFLIHLQLRRSKLQKWLRKNGQIIEATVQSVGAETMPTLGAVNEVLNNSGQTSFVITAQWVQPTTHSCYTFKSSLLKINPERLVKTGDTIKVAIDPNDPKRYWMDTSFLPVLK